MAETKSKTRTKREVIRSLRQPKVAVMLMLGFSSGLPFFLSGNTLGYWLRDVGTTLQTIGFLSWVGLTYSLKFLWAPIVDRVDAPLLGRLGRGVAERRQAHARPVRLHLADDPHHRVEALAHQLVVREGRRPR